MASFGEIYTVKVYYKGTSGPYKIRPVLIIDDSEILLIIFAEITTIKPNDPPKYFDDFKVEITKWQTFGLNKPSWVKCYRSNVHRVSQDKLIKKLGTVDSQIMTVVLNKVINQ